MPGIAKLHLEDAFDDSPQTRSLIGVFEKDATTLRNYTAELHRCCMRIVNAQQELSAATHGLSAHLKAYHDLRFPLENDESILTDTLKQFTVYLDELSSVQQILATQLGGGMMYPVNRFLQADLDEIVRMSQMYHIVSNEHEQSLGRYMKLSKKKDVEKTRQDCSEDLYAMRKKFHQTALHYFSSLNSLQYKRKVSLLEPLIGYMHAQKGFFAMGHEAVSRCEIDDFLANIQASIQGVQAELTQETLKTVDQMEVIDKQTAHMYHAELPKDMPYVPPNTSLTQKAGYLFLRSKQALIASKWERCYFFIQGGNLMCQTRNEVAGSLILDLNEEGTVASPVESDDRRYCLQIVSPVVKKTVILQAENDRERDEWVATINNVMAEGGYVKEKPRQKKDVGTSKTRGQSNRTSPEKMKEAHRSVPVGAAAPSPAVPSTVADATFIPDAPIQFDMISPSDESLQLADVDGPQRRINPFDQSPEDIHKDTPADNVAFSRTFTVRFLGSMEVKTDRGEPLVLETIRQIMAARAIHNVFKMTESRLVVSSEAMRLIDPSNNSVRTTFQLEDISYWATHSENKRLFGFITRTPPSKEQGDMSTFACHVFECNASADEICHAISTATKLAFEALLAARQSRTQQQPTESVQEKSD